MTAFNVLGTVTGLITVYLLLSLLCMAVNEYIQSKLKYRARDLEKWIMCVFDAHASAFKYDIPVLETTAVTKEQEATAAQASAHADPSNSSLAEATASAKAIASKARAIAETAKAANKADEAAKVAKKAADDANSNDTAAKTASRNANTAAESAKAALSEKLPNSAEFYAEPIISSLFKFKTESGPGSSLSQWVIGKTIKWDEKPAYIPSSTFALALMHLVFPDIGSTVAPKPDDYRTALKSLPDDSPLKPILQTLLNASGDSLASFRSGIESWFDAAMDRVAGDYKRIMMRSLFWLGLAVSLAVNADTFQFANSISKSSSLQQALGTLLPPLTVSEKTLPAPCSLDQVSKENSNCTDVARVLGELKAAGLPIGWTNPDFHPPHSWNNWLAWLYKLAGCILTAFAVSLGAPFWFDMLNKIMVIRSTVKPAE